MQNSTLETRQALNKDVEALKRDAVQVAQDVRNHATAHVDETKQRVTDTFVVVRDALTAHPLTLVGIGFAIGLVMGFRFRR